MTSVAANVLLAGAKFAGGLLGGSVALVADAVHSLSDLVVDGVVLVSTQIAAAPPDDDHPYGHGRFETLGTLVLSLILISTAVGIGWDSISRFESGEAPGSLALWVAVASIVVKELLFHYTLRIGKAIGSQAVIANAWHDRSDAASSLAVTAGILGAQLGYPILDPVAAVIVSALIGKMGLSLGWGALRELTDTSLEGELTAKVKAMAVDFPEVEGIHAFRARRMGPTVLVDFHLDVPGDWTVHRAHTLAETVEHKILEDFPQVGEVLIHIDPIEIEDPDRDSS